MLPTKILKLRLSRIQKGKEHLSTQDKLMLVSMESPDLSANFLLRLFKMSLPKQWKFHSETEEDVLYTRQLIQLIENEFIPAYEFHARKHAWYEQCLEYQLNFLVTEPNQQQINHYLRQLDQCLDQQPKLDLLRYFYQQYPTVQHATALAKSYAGATEYSKAIELYEWAAQQSTQRNEVAFYSYIECLVHRNQSEYKKGISDVEHAIDLLCRFEKPIDQKSYNKILDQSISRLLPSAILESRSAETSVFADVGRGLNSLGKTLGGIFGAKDLNIPLSKDVIASAPQLLSTDQIITSLERTDTLQQSFRRWIGEEQFQHYLKHNAGLLTKFWLEMEADPASIGTLSDPFSRLQLLEQLASSTRRLGELLDLADIQLILDQGTNAYFGEFRLNKQHPDREQLFVQREKIVDEMAQFAHWFYEHILTVYCDQQLKLFEQIQQTLLKQPIEQALWSALFAYQFERQSRAQRLMEWMQAKLEKTNDFENLQAAWVALRECRSFSDNDIPSKIATIQQELAQYKALLEQQKQQIDQDELNIVHKDEE